MAGLEGLKSIYLKRKKNDWEDQATAPFDMLTILKKKIEKDFKKGLGPGLEIKLSLVHISSSIFIDNIPGAVLRCTSS